MQKLTIIHFNPIEQYPPVLNWLNFLANEKGEGDKVYVITMHQAGDSDKFSPQSKGIKIIRAGYSGKRGIYAYLNYLFFYAVATWHLLRWRPKIVLYYETLSSLPAIFYKKYFRRRSRLFIHYHEYTSVNEYNEASQLVRWMHEREKNIYLQAEWISQTNAERINFFKADLREFDLPPVNALPNYPPASWGIEVERRDNPGLPVKIVYVGALSLETMYTKEFAEWVAMQSGKVIWDIYSDNITEDARTYLESFGNNLIRFRKAINYFNLPAVLYGYDVGVILYKGHIPNYVYNAPNKLFEYIVCGLDVWFPDIMKSSLPFLTEGTYPKVMAFDFQNLLQLNVGSVVGRTGLKQGSSFFYCEKALAPLLNKMKEN